MCYLPLLTVIYRYEGVSAFEEGGVCNAKGTGRKSARSFGIFSIASLRLMPFALNS